MRIEGRLGLLALLSTVWFAAAAAQAPSPAPAAKLTCTDIETFLKTAKIGRQRDIPVGVTVPKRATFDNGTLQHDAAIQTTDVFKPTFQTKRGTEVNFRDTWKFNVAGYELAKMLELNMVPPYVERRVAGADASVSWWVDDAMMELERVKKNITPPDVRAWNDQMLAARLFHELIGDTDFNMTNTLITKDWRVWMIDFSRAFRRATSLQYPEEVARIDRTLLANLRRLTLESLRTRVGRWLTKPELDAVIARRDALLGLLDKQIAAKGEQTVVYQLSRVSEPCGFGLD